MISFDRAVMILLLIWIFLYTTSYGWWTWKKKNKLGAIMVFFLATTALVLPLYTLFFRQ
jgi:hypothetical protein